MTPEDKKLLDALVAAGGISAENLHAKGSTLEETCKHKGITRAILEVFACPEKVIAATIAGTFGVGRMEVAPEMEGAPSNILTEDEILHFRALPVFRIGLELTVAFLDPPSRDLQTRLQQLTGYRVLAVVATISDFEAAMRKYRGALDKLARIESKVNLEQYDARGRKDKEALPARADQSEATMSELADELLLRAAKSGASDIHIEPGEHELLIRFRVDGVLQRILSLPVSAHPGLIAVLKARAGMDMFERAVPLDGRISLTFADRVFDVRINTLPLLYGEKMVLRLLGKTAMMTNLDNLGFSESNLRRFRSLLSLPNGIVLVTGPTGSGKTTTLYAGLTEIKSIGRNITTVENPVEYKLALINQVQVVPERGLTFATALRAILRQDPDVILVGEIRDAETGVIATEAALTGHLVLSTLHTNDAIGAIPRMINLGVESFWVSSSVIGVVAQRLVRRICVRCRDEYEPDRNELRRWGLQHLPSSVTLFRGRGCESCDGVGYKGRMAIHEVLVITEEMRDVIYGEVTTGKLRILAAANNFRDMYFDGLQKALAGLTTVEEIQRVVSHS